MKTPTEQQTILAALDYLLRQANTRTANLMLEDIGRLMADANPEPKSSADLTGQPITEPAAIAVLEAAAAYVKAPTFDNEKRRFAAMEAWGKDGCRLRIEEREPLGEGVDA